MKLNRTVAAITLAMAAVPMMASAQDWRGQRDRGNWNENNQGQQRDWRGERRDRDERRDRGDYSRERGRDGNGYYVQRGPVYQQRLLHGRHPIIVQRPVVVQRRPVVVHRGYGYRGYGAYRPGYGYAGRPWQVGRRYYGNGYAPTYVINDYNSYGLYNPPRGYSWRRDDFGNYLLVAIATGVITQLILGH